VIKLREKGYIETSMLDGTILPTAQGHQIDPQQQV
jgi:hypothetical protein